MAAPKTRGWNTLFLPQLEYSLSTQLPTLGSWCQTWCDTWGSFQGQAPPAGRSTAHFYLQSLRHMASLTDKLCQTLCHSDAIRKKTYKCIWFEWCILFNLKYIFFGNLIFNECRSTDPVGSEEMERPGCSISLKPNLIPSAVFWAESDFLSATSPGDLEKLCKDIFSFYSCKSSTLCTKQSICWISQVTTLNMRHSHTVDI